MGLIAALQNAVRPTGIRGAYGGPGMSMDQPIPTTIDAYIADFPPEVQAIFEQIRRTIHEAALDVEETNEKKK